MAKDRLLVMAERLQILTGERSNAQVCRDWHASEFALFTWRSGRNFPSAKRLIHISEAENVSVDWILGLGDTKEKRRPFHEVSEAYKAIDRYTPLNELEEIKKKAYLEAFAWVLRKEEKRK